MPARAAGRWVTRTARRPSLPGSLPRRGAAGRIPDDPDAHGPSRPAGSGAPRAADEFLAFRRRGRHWTQDSHNHHEPQPIARYLAEEDSDPRNGDDYPMTRPSDDPGQTPTPDRPAAPVNPQPAAIRNETSEAVASPSGEEDRFAKCPWLFRKGNKASVGNKNAAKKRMEHLIQRLTNNGDVIVQFFCAVASGQPFMIRVVKDLPMTKEQEAVAQGIATPEQKKIA